MAYLPIFILIGAILTVLWATSVFLMVKCKLPASEWWSRSLGLPRGSVRAIIALTFLFIITYCILTGTELPKVIPEWFIGILGMIVGFYFGAALITPPEKSPPPKPEESTKPKP